jgi:hypothetical protein
LLLLLLFVVVVSGADGLPVSSLNPPSALKLFISSLPKLFPEPETCWGLLLSLLPQATSRKTQSLPTNPLFDEDPVNDYAEELVSMRCVADELTGLLFHLRETKSLTLQHYEDLAGHLRACQLSRLVFRELSSGGGGREGRYGAM